MVKTATNCYSVLIALRFYSNISNNFLLHDFFYCSIDNWIADTTLNSTELSVNLTFPNATNNSCQVTYNATYEEVDVHIVSSCSITFTICWLNTDVYICIQLFHIGHYRVTITATDEPGNSAPCDIFDLWIIGEYLRKDK